MHTTAPPLKHGDFDEWARGMGFRPANLTTGQRIALLRLFASNQRRELAERAANAPENRELRTRTTRHANWLEA